SKLYEYLIEHNHVLLDSKRLDAINGGIYPIKGFFISQTKFLQTYINEVSDKNPSINRQIGKIDTFFYIPPPIEKDDIYRYFHNISPITHLVDLSNITSVRDFKNRMNAEIVNFFGKYS